jgi:hypothetical protein
MYGSEVETLIAICKITKLDISLIVRSRIFTHAMKLNWVKFLLIYKSDNVTLVPKEIIIADAKNIGRENDAMAYKNPRSINSIVITNTSVILASLGLSLNIADSITDKSPLPTPQRMPITHIFVALYIL